MQKPTLTLKFLFVVLFACIVTIACSSDDNDTKQEPGLKFSDTDYSDMNNWLLFDILPNKDIDIFVIYPTMAGTTEDDGLPYVNLNSVIMRERANNWLSNKHELLSFNANIYAPVYRQVSFLQLFVPGVVLDPLVVLTPREDIFAAFDYYLRNVNKGERPFIIFGHSQGAHLCKELATTFLGHASYSHHNKNLIACYSIGISVIPDYLKINPSIKFSQSKDDLCVMISYNSTAPSEATSDAYTNFGTWKQGALVTNPISWTTNGEHVPATENGYTFWRLSDGTEEKIYNFADATGDNAKGILIISSVDEALAPATPPILSKFHQLDIDLFYESIMNNIKDRIEAFKTK